MSNDTHEPQLEQNPAASPDGLRLATRLQHAGYQPPAGFDSVQPATHRASTVIFPNVAAMRARDWRHKTGYTYGLHGTPTTFTLEARLAEIEGAAHCMLCPSGLAAIALVDLALLAQGDGVLLPANVYGPSRELAERLLAGLGIRASLYDPMNPASVEASITPRTRLLWLEAPGSVTLEMPDLRGLVAIARRHGITTAIDNTWAAGLAIKPFEVGIDISMQALTKYQSGGADMLMGAVMTCDGALHERLLYAHMRLGLGVGGDDATLVLRGLHSLALRYAAHDRSARRIAAWMREQPEVQVVLHPALPGSPGHAHWARDCSGAAGLFSFTFHPQVDARRVDAFVDALRLFKIGYSWGGPVSLAVPYDAAAMRGGAWPYASPLVRLCIGLEDPDDLIADIAQAMRVALR
ncbi:cystathionine beta-lyase MetC [mine drainage metagenome]|uniref:Cystathionine beta-lyase MetC n=1 Tax=mine drainage metagenome TaxID=410659 RepID=A0A1J5QWG8_9ZZZZ